jgi:hypothetical protein
MSGHATIAGGVRPLWDMGGRLRLTNRLPSAHIELTSSRKTRPSKKRAPADLEKLNTPSPQRRVPALAALLGILAATLVALAVPAPALASPCGDKVLADWFDNGRIDRLYPLHCYEDAIDSIPNDLRDYANAEEIINRALQAAVKGNLDAGGPDPSPDDPGSSGGSGGGSGGTRDPGAPSDPGPGAPESEAAPDVDTTGLSSVPLPLIVLGLMSLALLGAGGLGYLRRRHDSNDQDTPGPPDDLAV